MTDFLGKINFFCDRECIIFKDKTYNYTELYNKVLEIKNNVLDKIEQGRIVAILSDYSFESIALLLALYENKNIIVPITSTVEKEINERLNEAFVDYTVKIIDNSFLIHNREYIDKKHELIDSLISRKKSGLILFSSGSTGKPKAMIHDLDNLISHYQNKKIKSLNMILFLMFDHIGGLNTLFNIISMGATMIIPENRNADSICKLIQDYKVTVLPSSPSFLNLILISEADKKYNLDSLRMITYGTENMPDELLYRLKKRFPKVKFLQTFGTSETGIANTSSKSSDSTFMKIDDLDLEYKIVDNELWLKSKTQIMGYLNVVSDSFTSDGWFKTGDLVEVQGEFIKIIGRSKEVINVGGEKVLPNEVENVILKIEFIKDCIVYGEKNIITGQTVVCDVVTSLDKNEIKSIIRNFCKDKIEAYKIPTKINVVESIDFGSRFKKNRRKS